MVGREFGGWQASTNLLYKSRLNWKKNRTPIGNNNRRANRNQISFNKTQTLRLATRIYASVHLVSKPDKMFRQIYNIYVNLIQKQFKITKLCVLKFRKVIFKYFKIHFRMLTISKSLSVARSVTFILTFSHDSQSSHELEGKLLVHVLPHTA